MRLILAALLAAASLPAESWKLPQRATVVDHGPRSYRFTVDYNYANTVGKVVRRDRVTATYTRGLPGGVARWSGVSVAESAGVDAPFGPGAPRDYMEGFRYTADQLAGSLRPEFFSSFPPAAAMERNLVWDTQMIEAFGQTQLARLKLNEPFQFASSKDMDLGGLGKFQNRDVRLTWTGVTLRGGSRCAVIDYQAFHNPMKVDVAGVKMTARSHYWGQVWVSLRTLQIEYATLYEDVLGEMTLPGQNSARPVNVFRNAVFEPVAK